MIVRGILAAAYPELLLQWSGPGFRLSLTRFAPLKPCSHFLKAVTLLPNPYVAPGSL